MRGKYVCESCSLLLEEMFECTIIVQLQLLTYFDYVTYLLGYNNQHSYKFSISNAQENIHFHDHTSKIHNHVISSVTFTY